MPDRTPPSKPLPPEQARLSTPPAVSIQTGRTQQHAAMGWRLPRPIRRPNRDDLPLLHWPDQAPLGSPAATHHIQTILDGFLATCRQPTTVVSYRKALRGFFAWWGSDGQAGPLTITLLRSYQEFLRATVEPRTVNFYVATLRSLCNWLVKNGELPWNPMEEIPSLRIPKGFVRDSLTEAEIRRLLAAMPREGPTPRATEAALRNYAIAVLWCATGLRSIELARAHRRHLDAIHGHQVLYVHGKGDDMATKPVVLEPWVLGPLTAYLDAHDHGHHAQTDNPASPIHDHHALFCWVKGPGSYRSRKDNPALTRGCKPISVQVVQKMMRIALRTPNVLDTPPAGTRLARRVTPHSIRHSTATIALEHGAPLLQVKDMLRHADIQTTMQYVHNKERITHAAEHQIPDFTSPPDQGLVPPATSDSPEQETHHEPSVRLFL